MNILAQCLPLLQKVLLHWMPFAKSGFQQSLMFTVNDKQCLLSNLSSLNSKQYWRKYNFDQRISLLLFKAEAHRHKENRAADRKRTNQNILPIRKNLMFYSLSESANKSVDFAPFWKRNRKFTRSLLTCFTFPFQPLLTSRKGLGKIMMMS